MLPFYFGPADSRLFGVYHAPDAPVRPCGVLLCHPLGHEYIRAHRTFRQLAVELSRAGFPVLRFDYFGCGDSAGTGEEGSVDRWMADVATAVEELKDSAGVSTVAIVGVRLGASVALLSAGERADVTRMVLWDPVLSGRGYLNDLAALQRRWLKGRPGSRLFAFRPRATELIGFPVSERLRRELEAMDLRALRDLRVQVDVIGSHAHGEYSAWAGRVSDRGCAAACHPAPAAGDWDRADQVHTGLSAPGVVQHVASLLGDAA